MYGKEEWELQCRKIQELLEEDKASLSRFMKGEVFDAYQKLIRYEEELLDSVKHDLRILSDQQ